ncbi:MAG TPA: hypothetical protein VNS46_16440 [Nocardioides sp.]|nr:hypothetical protein [Nocardioides sp.]
MPTSSNAYDLSVEIRTPAGRDVRAGWIPGENTVVVLMTPDAADVVGKALLRAAAISAHQVDQDELVHAACELFSSAARATFLESSLQLVPKLDIPTSSADLDRHDQANITLGAVGLDGSVQTMREFVDGKIARAAKCVCGEAHPYDGAAFDVPADDRCHGLVHR